MKYNSAQVSILLFIRVDIITGQMSEHGVVSAVSLMLFLCHEDGVIIYMTVLRLGLLHVGAASETQSRAGPH